jgi:GTPase SAR1 family protein
MLYKKQSWRDFHSQPAFNLNHICSMNEADKNIFHCANGSQAQCLHKKLLIQFWKCFLKDKSVKGGNKIKREALKENFDEGVKTQVERLKVITDYAKIIIGWKTDTYKKRIEFNKIKKTLHRPELKINTKCFVCLGQAHCRHHIIQLQHGGLNQKKNIVSLCSSCHAEIHPWLKTLTNPPTPQKRFAR